MMCAPVSLGWLHSGHAGLSALFIYASHARCGPRSVRSHVYAALACLDQLRTIMGQERHQKNGKLKNL